VQSNVIASINNKLGGSNWALQTTLQQWGLPANARLCIMGMDVCHGDTSSSSSKDGGQSVVALCASLDPYFSRYFTSIRYQSARQEVVIDLPYMVKECLKEYQINNSGALPTHLLFYRDGVGEGMYDKVETIEMNRLFPEAFEENKMKPLLTFVVVQKRNHLRACIEQNGFSHNPPYGTLIDQNVVDAESENFYLWSHQATIGTSKPTHYQILRDDCKFGLQNLESLTFALSHLHQGCPRSVSMPSVVFYADKACFRVSQYYDGEKNVNSQVQQGFMI